MKRCKKLNGSRLVLIQRFYGLVVKWREFNSDRKTIIAVYAIATWVISSEKT